MRGLMALTRRRFAQGLGVALSLSVTPRMARAHGGPHELTVDIAHFAFTPARIEIFMGDSIKWFNTDLVPHSATAEDGVWDTGSIEPGGFERITFGTLGEFPYFCAFHTHMKGTVVVTSKPGQ